jgi:wobble nucleotide-excising tRNase
MYKDWNNLSIPTTVSNTIMLRKILHIKNLGLFNDAKCSSHEFDKATLIYAENGRGKSTLASILRACTTSNTDSIVSRKTLGSGAAPEVKLLFRNEDSQNKIVNVEFKEDKWLSSYPGILVFDAEFVDRNVHSGNLINPNHKQEFLGFALGEDAVRLKQEIDSEAHQISEKTKEINNTEKALANCRKELSLDEFVDLPLNPDVEAQIIGLESRLGNATNNKVFKSKACPDYIPKPSLDIESLFEILSATLDDIHEDAGKDVFSHIENCSTEGFENWLSQGQLFEDEENCPYCKQTLFGNGLVKAYKTYFNQSYKNFKDKIVSQMIIIDKHLSDLVLARITSTAEKNQLILEDRTEYMPLERIEFRQDELSKLFHQIHELLYNLLEDKKQNPLETVGTESNKEKANSLWGNIKLTIAAYNQSIDLSINSITSFKSQLDSDDSQKIQQEIDALKLVKTRHETNTCNLISKWIADKEEKDLHEKKKETARYQLDTLMTGTLSQYQNRINTLVEKFGVLFEIENLSHNYKGGAVPRSSYGLKVKGQSVQLSAKNGPSFSTALSEGDKRTLAFAFFIARIESDDLENKIVVIDDPVCSLDNNRRHHTKQILRDIGIKAKQIIILGHDSHFLRDLKDDFKKNKVKIPTQLLKIKQASNNHSDFSCFDVDKECASPYYRNYDALQEFSECNEDKKYDLLTVARSIRPLLEGYLHRRFPRHIRRQQLFGTIIGDASSATDSSPLFYLKPLITELNEINDYAGQFHHDANDDNYHLTEPELRSYVHRALLVIHKGSPNGESDTISK